MLLPHLPNFPAPLGAWHPGDENLLEVLPEVPLVLQVVREVPQLRVVLQRPGRPLVVQLPGAPVVVAALRRPPAPLPLPQDGGGGQAQGQPQQRPPEQHAAPLPPLEKEVAATVPVAVDPSVLLVPPLRLKSVVVVVPSPPLRSSHITSGAYRGEGGGLLFFAHTHALTYPPPPPPLLVVLGDHG